MLMGSAAHADCRTDVSGCYNSVRWWLLQGKTTIGSWERFSLAKLTKLTEVILQQVTTANRERERERERRKKKEDCGRRRRRSWTRGATGISVAVEDTRHLDAHWCSASNLRGIRHR